MEALCSREDITGKQDCNNSHIQQHTRFEAEDQLGRPSDLHGAVAHMSGNGAEDGKSGERIEGSRQLCADDLRSEDGDQQRAGAEWSAFVENDVAQHQTGRNAGAVRAECSGHKAVHHGENDRLIAARDQVLGRIGLEREDQRLCNAPEQNAGADVRTEGDAKPLEIAEFRFGVGAVQFDLPHGGQHCEDQEDDDKRAGKAGSPAEVIHTDVHDQRVERGIKCLRIDRNTLQELQTERWRST